MKRLVPIIVTDDEVDSFSIEFHGPDGHRGVSAYHVPPDDQWTRDLRFALHKAEHLLLYNVNEDEPITGLERVRALRVAFRLDEEKQ